MFIKLQKQNMVSGIITRKLSDKFCVKTKNDEKICFARGNLKENGIFVGDSVILDSEEGVIEEILERKNLLKRPPLANLDQLFIVLAEKPAPDFLMLDKLILFCLVKGIEPIILLNKIDLSKKNLEYLEKVYGEVFKVISVSAKEKVNIDKVISLFKGKISAFSGQSGVGKSALINSIFNDKVMLEGFLSDKIMRGKNTTRHCQLFEFNDGLIADTPGFTALDAKYLDIQTNELPYFYPDFLNWHNECEYKSCSHTSEINCGVKKAVQKENLDRERYERYLIIRDEIISGKKY